MAVTDSAPRTDIAPERTETSALAPFRSLIVLAMWIANVVSYFGGLIQSVGASWLMTSPGIARR